MGGSSESSGFEIIRSWQDVLWPLAHRFLAGFATRFLVKIWPFRLFAMTNFIMARPCPKKPMGQSPCFRIVAARNEAGNIADIFTRTPEMGGGTELVLWKVTPVTILSPSSSEKFLCIQKEKHSYIARRYRKRRMPCALDLQKRAVMC